MIQTVTGQINEKFSGDILIHEHIRTVSNDMLHTFGKKWLDEDALEDYAVEILRQLKEQLGISIFVDGTPCDLGRDVRLLKRVSEKSGVKIVASTGLYWFPHAYTGVRSAREIADLLLEECTHGMEGTDIRPGILKCAVDELGMTEDVKKRNGALGIVQAETGLPLYAHCSHEGFVAQQQIDVLLEHGANPQKVVIGHVSRRMDADYLETLLKRGVSVCVDQSYEGEEKQVAKVVAELCKRGYGKKLLFSHDRCLYNEFTTREWTGLHIPQETHVKRYAFLSQLLIPAIMSEGCSREECEEFLHGNAMQFLNVI